MPTTTLTPRRARKILQLASELVRITTPLADDAMRRLMGNDHGFRWWRPADPKDEESHRDWRRLVSYSDLCDEITREVSRMKMPVKDDVTIPWMSSREIPAVKAALSAWRKLRKDRQKVSEIRKEVMEDGWPHAFACSVAEVCGVELEKLAALNERLKKGAVK